jgi:hypothetical protein
MSQRQCIGGGQPILLLPTNLWLHAHFTVSIDLFRLPSIVFALVQSVPHSLRFTSVEADGVLIDFDVAR